MKKEKNTLLSTISYITVGQSQKSANLEVFPLFNSVKSKTKYITLKDGLAKGFLEVVEKSESGSVPELRVINKGNKRVLLLDGEELSGAKQNRILNTSILLKKHSDTIIPVSCTEAGRWQYQTDKFYDSDVVATPSLRKKKAVSVLGNLNLSHEFRSDQGEVWNMVDNLLPLVEGDIPSPTRAMKDVFEHKKNDTDTYLNEIRLMEGQHGFIIAINGKVVGIDYFSSAKVFKKLHNKLLKSYALEASIHVEDSFPAFKELAESFLEHLKEVTVTRFKSPGHGYDLRLSGAGLSGNALEYRGEIIHLAVFDFQEDPSGSQPRFRNPTNL
jgi:hypothetical protein